VVDFTPSIAPGIAGSEIDFTPGDIIWQVQEYVWNFGDGTAVVRTMNPAHSFKNPGKYSISLTVRYSDGTQKTQTKEYVVESTLIN
jgi:PKD repeat protein